MLPSRLQSLADGIDARSNAYYATVVHDRIRVSNVADATWRGQVEAYAASFARITGLVSSIDWQTGEIWLGPAVRP